MGIGNLSKGFINLFKRSYSKAFINEDIIFSVLNKDELIHLYPHCLQDLKASKHHGFLIKNFLTKEEANLVLKNFNDLPKHKINETPVGRFYPKVFPELNNDVKVCKTHEERKSITDKFFESNTKFKETFINTFGVDVFGRLINLFSQLSDDFSVSVPKGFNNYGHYPFGTFRSFNPESGILTIHCGNYFQSEYQVVYDDLVKTVEVKDQLSYFIMLQPADEGGALRVFNLRWKDGMTKPSMMNDEDIITPDNKIIKISSDKNIHFEDITPDVGDMILFQGGNIWHKVTRIQGNKSRVTFGGFMGYSKVKNEYLIWG